MLFTKDVVAMCAFLVSLCIGPLAFGLMLVYLSQYRAQIGTGIASGILLAHIFAIIAGVAVVWSYMLQPEDTWIPYPNNTDAVQTLMGSFVTVIYPALGFAATSVLASYWCACRGSRSAGVAPRMGGGRSIQPDGLRHNWRGAAVALLVICAAGVACSFLSPVWNYSPPSYFGSDSVYSLIHVALNFNGHLLYVKLYEDIVVFYGVLLGLAGAGLLATYYAPARRAMHARFAPKWLAGLPAWLAGEWRHGVSSGEVGLITSLVGLTAYWLYYWAVRYDRIRIETATMNDPYPAAQNAARVLGHMTSLFMSLSTFPAARGGALESLFGVPFDRGIKYHRALGRMVWLCVTAHMVVWQAKWAAEGILWNNVFTVDNLLITGYCEPGQAPPGCYEGSHADNWTIPVVEAAWLVLTIALLFAIFSRRTSYELFHYTHHAVWVFFLAALTHAWGHWYYVSGGLMLYLIDKLARTVRASGAASIVAAVHAGGVTRLTLEVSDALTNAHYAGQYLFLNIPSVDPLQWHPYTISSAPSVVTDAGAESSPFSTVTVHVKAMGKGTWSEGVAKLADGLADEAASSKAFGAAAGADSIPGRLPVPLSVSVDGPYGRAGHYAQRRCVVLVAGGIGITPMHSILSDLHARAVDPETYGPPGAVTRVHLVWTVREAAVIGHFAESLANVLRSNPGGMFSLAIHVTGSAVSELGLEPYEEGGPKGYESAPGFRVHESRTVGSSGSEALDAPLIDSKGSSSASGPSPVAAGLCTQESFTQLASLASPGRPQLGGLLSDIAQEAVQEHYAEGGGSDFGLSDLVSVLVCGPPGMIDEASAASAELGLDFHSEVFHF